MKQLIQIAGIAALLLGILAEPAEPASPGAPGTPGTPAAPAEAAASSESLIRAHHDELNRGDWQRAAEDFSVDTRNFGRPVGRAVIKRIFDDIYRIFPDFRLEITDLFTRGDLVVVRCKESGTHRGVGRIPIAGGMLVGVAPTQKHFEAEVVHFYTVRDGKIVDHSAVRDDLAMMQQLGLVAEPKPFDWASFAAEANRP